MSISFSGSELINIAIGIEGRGVAFYDSMADSTKNATAREVFRYLADMEREHMQIFQGMLPQADKFQFAETAGEYAVYLQTLVDSAIFSDDPFASKMASGAESDIAALDLAIGAEKDSILFYYEMRDIMPRRAQPTVNKIIAEEKSHLRQLSELKKELVGL
jgi:rubrerythrin